MTDRTSPVIIITGTPGTGKSSHAHLLAEESSIPLQHINVGDFVKEKGLYDNFDEEWQSYNVDEDQARPSRSIVFCSIPTHDERNLLVAR